MNGHEHASGAASELNHPDAQALLRSAPLARLAYAGPDGYPRAIPIGFWWDGEQVIVCTVPISPKVAALLARPQVALTIDTETFPPQALLLRGIASIETVDGVPAEYIAASAKSVPAEQLSEFEANVRTIYREMSRISIAITWARFYDFAAGRVPEFLHRLAGGT
jgi:hypothetical protein